MMSLRKRNVDEFNSLRILSVLRASAVKVSVRILTAETQEKR